jgi:hypothetical protein
MVRDIGDAQKALADITGQAPKFFRAPFGIRTPLTEPALARLGSGASRGTFARSTALIAAPPAWQRASVAAWRQARLS